MRSGVTSSTGWPSWVGRNPALWCPEREVGKAPPLAPQLNHATAPQSTPNRCCSINHDVNRALRFSSWVFSVSVARPVMKYRPPARGESTVIPSLVSGSVDAGVFQIGQAECLLMPASPRMSSFPLVQIRLHCVLLKSENGLQPVLQSTHRRDLWAFPYPAGLRGFLPPVPRRL